VSCTPSKARQAFCHAHSHAAQIEQRLIDQIRVDPALAGMLAELYFEQHHNHPAMQPAFGLQARHPARCTKIEITDKTDNATRRRRAFSLTVCWRRHARQRG